MNLKFFFENGKYTFLDIPEDEQLSTMELLCDLASFNSLSDEDKDYNLELFDRIRDLEIKTKEDFSLYCRPATAYILSEIIAENSDFFSLKTVGVSIFNSVSQRIKCFIDNYNEFKNYRKPYREQVIVDESQSLIDYFGKFPPITLETQLYKGAIRDIYTVNHLYQLILFDIIQGFTHIYSEKFDIEIKKCLNCNRYFIVKTRSNVKYCDYPSPQNPKYRCSDNMVKMNYSTSAVKTEIKQLYRKIYVYLQVNTNRHPETFDNLKDFNEFKNKSKEWKILLANNQKTEEEYLEWLKNYKYKNE